MREPVQIQPTSLGNIRGEPVDIGEAEFPEAVLAHLEQVGQAQLPVRARLAAHLHQVRLKRPPERRCTPAPVCTRRRVGVRLPLVSKQKVSPTQPQRKLYNCPHAQ